MKKLMFATALVASAAAFADPINAISFEGYTADTGATVGDALDQLDVSGGTQAMYFLYQGEQDGSTVKAYGVGDNLSAPSMRTAYFAGSAATQNNYLDLSTEGGILWRSINVLGTDGPEGGTSTNVLGAAKAVAESGTYLDTLVQFTPTEDGNAPEVDDQDKLAIWLNVDSSGSTPVTNLMVRAGYINDNGTATSCEPTTYTLSTTAPIVAGQWYRLTIKAIADVTQCMAKNSEGYANGFTGFEIYLDGQQLAATTSTFGSGYISLATDAGEYGWLDQTADADFVTYLQSGKVFPSLLGATANFKLQAIGFKGSGALDDIVWTEEDPLAAVALDFTLTWPAGFTPVSYTINGGEAQTISAGSTSPFQVPGVMSGDTVAFTFTNADGATKTMSLEAAADATDIDASTATYVWADYLGDAVNGAYTIDDANDLDMLRKGVAANLATLGETFKQTANIDMTSAAAFAGVGTYAANLNSGLAFQGTYDGQGFKIANITMTARNYGGVFNQVKGGTIKDLTVENITAPANATGEFGYSIVGNAGLGATLQGLTAMGSFGTAELPCSHNVAGIAIRVCGGASNVVNGVTMLETLVKDCTNNATLYGFYTKCAGITALTQDQNGVPNDYVLFDGCVNNANIAMVQPSGSDLSKIGRDGLGGILAYVADGTKMQNCVNNGTLTSPLTTAKIGGIVGWAQGRTLDDLGGNANPAAAKMIGDPAGSTITGFKYATVAGNKATTVLPPLTAGTTYLLEGNVAASETPVFTLAADGDTIAFDTALGYTFAGTIDSAQGLFVSDSTTGSVTTYAAATAIAEITGGAKYASLQAAVDAATAGDTVTVLADCTISGTPLSIAKNLTIHNDHTITGAVNYAICIGATVSFEGSGKIERASGITGSAFCVGANETTRGAITVGTAGTLNFTGLTVCGGSGGNLIKLENGTVNMTGGVLRDGKRGIKADADAGSYTSAIVITGGTITNNTDCAVMASAESATGTATVTINGGVIAGALTIDKTAGTCSITIPGTSTAMFNADQSAFCESGYETTDGDNDGWFTVSAVQSAGGYKVVIAGSDVAITPTAEDFDAMVAAVPGLDTNDVNAVNAALATEIGSTGIPAWQAAFLGLPPTVAGLESFKIDSISIAADGKVTVTLPAGVDPKTGRGVDITIKLMGSDDLSTWSFIENATGTTFGAVTPGSGETKKFYKVVVEFAGSSN